MISNKARVDVLVTFYNQEKYVDQAIESIISQKTDFGVNILVGDDGSSDNTQNIVRKWIDRYPNKIRLYVMDRQPGIQVPGFRASRNRLNLLEHVTSEYFIFLDGDDYYCYDGKIQKQVEILDDISNRDCIACGHNTDMLFPDGKKVGITSNKIAEGKYEKKEYWKDMYFHTDSLLIRSTIIPKIPKQLLENNFNDNLITFSVIQYGSLYYIPESWVIYTQTGTGIWTSSKKIVNLIRNMYLYDLCNRINPDLKKETSYRSKSTWWGLFLIRKEINDEVLEPYKVEARDKELEYSYKWIGYQHLNYLEKMDLYTITCRLCWKRFIKQLLAMIPATKSILMLFASNQTE